MTTVSQKCTDAELIALLKAGNQFAFTKLYHRYSGKMYLNMLKMVKDELIVEEMVQVLFSRIWQNRMSIEYETDFSGYLYRAGQNLVYDFYRKLQRDRKLCAHFKSISTEHYTHIEEALYFRESEEMLQKALARLSPQQRNVYQLCKLDGCSYKETATQLGISPHTVKEYLGKARQLVKTYLLSKHESVISLLFFFWLI
ncbi:MAG: RNA polymerase sigma factor [Sphingobacteriaceae bacterium]